MELIKAGEKTYYIEHDTNIGVYMTGPDRVCLIDTGSRGDGEKIDEVIKSRGWDIDYIINTHTHIDHLGGNEYFMNKYKIPAYCTDYDMAFAHYSDLEAAYMTGGYPCQRMRKIFSHPGKLGFEPIERKALAGLQWTYLPGHTFGMIGVRTDDNVWFLADAYLSREYIKKHRFGYLYDVGGYLDTLEYIKGLEGELFVPAHGIAEKDITHIANLNIANVQGIIDTLKDICANDYISTDNILRAMFAEFGLRCSFANHALLSSTIKGYLVYMQDRDEMECRFIDNVMMWKTI